VARPAVYSPWGTSRMAVLAMTDPHYHGHRQCEEARIRDNSFTEDEVVLCAYAALHDGNEFGGIDGVHRWTNHSTSSISMKIRNIAAMLEQDGLPRNHGPVSKAASKSGEGYLHERPLAGSFMGLLLKPSGLHLHTRKRDEFAASGRIFSPLNRHGVLHGLDCHYATLANRLRGIALISFLDCVAQVIPTEKNPQQCDETGRWNHLCCFIPCTLARRRVRRDVGWQE
jgi:hypothetical protein